jgi:hypothetical protein
MTTYGNGKLCSKLLYNSLNRAYLERVASYYSYHAMKGTQNVTEYVPKDDGFIKTYPPLGDTIRDVYDEACLIPNNPWGISDYDRHTREIQGVGTNVLFAQDHTHEVVKNYFHRKRMGATTLWDVATDTGEIAAAVLVPTTKTCHYSHAAIQLSKRPSFCPTAMYSDTWPCKNTYWELLIPNLAGRLGLFHYQQRIVKTLRKTHIDYYRALNHLLDTIYF